MNIATTGFLAAVACSPTGSAGRSTTLITIADAPHGKGTAVDLGPSGGSQGDLFVFDEPLLDEHGKPIGSNSGFCVRSGVAEISECQWTLTLAQGSITLAGREAAQGASMLTVVGGTAAYFGVRGEAASAANQDGTFTQTLRLLFP